MEPSPHSRPRTRSSSWSIFLTRHGRRLSRCVVFLCASVFLALQTTLTFVNHHVMILRLRHTGFDLEARRLHARYLNSRFSPLLRLPLEIRECIYHHLFAGSRIRVCSFNKDHTSATYAHDERCQILLTCRACYDEALPLFYSLVEFEIRKASALSYFTFHDEDREKIKRVTTLVLDKSLLTVFRPSLFPRLKLLVLDLRVAMFLEGEILNEHQRQVLKVLKPLCQYKTKIKPELAKWKKKKQKWFSIALQFKRHWQSSPDLEHEEMLLVYLRRLKLVHEFSLTKKHSPPEWLPLPSAEDVMAIVEEEDSADD